jgi:hypothetical protein
LYGRYPDWKVNPTLYSNLGETLAVKPDFRLLADKQRRLLPKVNPQYYFQGPVLAKNAVVFLTNIGVSWHVEAVDRTDLAVLWDIKLPDKPIFNGTSLTRDGDVLVPLVDGRVVCIGRKE